MHDEATTPTEVQNQTTPVEIPVQATPAEKPKRQTGTTPEAKRRKHNRERLQTTKKKHTKSVEAYVQSETHNYYTLPLEEPHAKVLYFLSTFVKRIPTKAYMGQSLNMSVKKVESAIAALRHKGFVTQTFGSNVSVQLTERGWGWVGWHQRQGA